MRILFDHGTSSGIARSLAGHEVTEAIERGWDRLSNGQLLATAEAAGFDLLLTTDKNIRYQQNLKGRRIAIVVLGCEDHAPLIMPVARLRGARGWPHRVARQRVSYSK